MRLRLSGFALVAPDGVAGLDACDLVGHGLRNANPVNGHEDRGQSLEPDDAARNADDAQKLPDHGEQRSCGGDQSEGEIENRDDGRKGRGGRAALFGPHQVEFLAGDQRRRKGREQKPCDLEKSEPYGIEHHRAAQNRTEQRVKTRTGIRRMENARECSNNRSYSFDLRVSLSWAYEKKA